MGTIVSSGVGSGLDVANLVNQLVAAEGAPTSIRLDREEASLQGELSGLGSFRSALDTLNGALGSLTDLESFRGRAVTLSGTDNLSATATSAAVAGSYDIEVERLASAHRLASDPLLSSDSVLGTGTLTFSSASGGFSVLIDSSSNTLAGIRDAINSAETNTGVLATIINGVDGSRLILTQSDAGAANALTVIQTGGDGGLDPLVYDPLNGTTNMTEVAAPQDARILVNGFAVESSTNSISDAVDGLSIELVAANLTGETTTVSIKADLESSRQQITGFVDAYNAFVDTTAELSSFDPETQARGLLFGDSTLTTLTSRLRRELTETVSGLTGPFNSLFDIGITTQLDGKLSLDAARLDAAFSEDFDAVGTLFADATGGIATRLDALISPQLDGDGALSVRTDGINASIEFIGDRREALNNRLAAVEERLFRQFNALDSLLAQLQSTSGFLTQQLDNLPGVASFNTSNN